MARKNVKKKTNVGIRVKNKFVNAGRGVFTALQEESTLLIYLIMIIVCIGLGIWLKLTYIEWAIIVLTIGIVVSFEFVNTSIESFVDLLSFEYNERAKKIKDICAAASILSAFASLVVGFLIYLPKLIDTLAKLLS
jgi:undecaprenol kinase